MQTSWALARMESNILICRFHFSFFFLGLRFLFGRRVAGFITSGVFPSLSALFPINRGLGVGSLLNSTLSLSLYRLLLFFDWQWFLFPDRDFQYVYRPSFTDTSFSLNRRISWLRLNRLTHCIVSELNSYSFFKKGSDFMIRISNLVYYLSHFMFQCWLYFNSMHLRGKSP